MDLQPHPAPTTTALEKSVLFLKHCCCSALRTFVWRLCIYVFHLRSQQKRRGLTRAQRFLIKNTSLCLCFLKCLFVSQELMSEHAGVLQPLNWWNLTDNQQSPKVPVGGPPIKEPQICLSAFLLPQLISADCVADELLWEAPHI